MIYHKCFSIKFAVCTLILFTATAHAEWMQKRWSQGNNVGFCISNLNGGPWGSPTGNKAAQFPKGSGNYWSSLQSTGAWTLVVAKDVNGDGVAEDTLGYYSRNRGLTFGRASLEYSNELAALFNAGERMDQACARIEHDRVWSSLDAGDLAEWPPEFRVGRTASGEPVLHGAETIVTLYSDPFRIRSAMRGVPNGVSMEYAFYFLNYGESNNMVYCHLFMRNVSEFIKWNFDESVRTVVPDDGFTWIGWCLTYNSTNFFLGAVNKDERYTGWFFKPSAEIYGQLDPLGLDPTMNPQETFVVGNKVLRPPSFKGEVMKLTNCEFMRGGNMEHGLPDFGNRGGITLFGSSSAGPQYRASLGIEPLHPDFDNPWTGQKSTYGWPGLIPKDCEYYDKWLWACSGQHFWPMYSELHDFAPRDTTSLDWVIMFVMPQNAPMVMPPNELPYINDLGMQEGLEPVEAHGDVAQTVFEGGYILPETPVPPTMTIIPGDKQVTITWSDVNLHSPDAYYYFLQKYPELDPSSVYREYDFEGYRLYRSYVGPSDSHSELIFDCSLSADNIQFYYVDRLDNDVPYYRMRNGLRAWYALVPYDRNYDVATGDAFSLPDPASGKVWNRPGEGLYSVIPRSDASNFTPAAYGGVSYVGAATIQEPTVALSGDGTGKLTEPPKFLEPPLDFSMEIVNSERITQDITVYVACTGTEVLWGCDFWAYPQRVIALLDANGNVIQAASPYKTRDALAQFVFMNTPDASGVNYAVHVLWDHPGNPGNRDYAPVYIDFNTGGYTGATVANQFGSCVSSRVGTGPSIGSYIRTGVFEVTWKSAGSDLTVEVTDKTRGVAVPFSPYRDDVAWGFMPGGTYMDFFNEVKSGVSKSERANLMLEKIPADNTEEFAISINGIVWAFTDITAMPASGTVMTITNAFGDWNADKTVFTQIADSPFPGDKWEIKIKPMSMNPEDADLSKIKVVPNPYLASSFLDLSPNSRRIEFVNLPARCTIRIYSLGGRLVNVLNHIGASRQGWGNYQDWDRLDANNQPMEFKGWENHGGTEPWNLRNRFGHTVASGLYFYHVADEAGKENTGSFYIIN
ncbi:MAG TPA: hypothetical protein VM123_16170 [archaeon]|nr:hypothetical protein [archaeon]